MANFNKVIMAGRLTRDPQLSMLPSNTPVCDFGMAINRKWKSQSGEMRDDTCFIDLRIYGRRAEVINQYMSKGRPLMIEGRLEYQHWEGKDGVKRSKHIVIVENFEFLGSGQREPTEINQLVRESEELVSMRCVLSAPAKVTSLAMTDAGPNSDFFWNTAIPTLTSRILVSRISSVDRSFAAIPI